MGANQYSVKPLARKSPPRKDTSFRRLEKQLPREEWTQILEKNASDDRVSLLIEMLNSHEYRKHSLPTMANRCGLTYGELLRMVTTARLDEGILRMSAHVPDVLEDTAIDAKSKLVACPNCKGKKVVILKKDKDGLPTETEECVVCDGVGKLRKIGDADARKVLFEAIGLTNKKVPMVNVNQNFAGGIQPVESTLTDVRKILEVQALPEKTDGTS